MADQFEIAHRTPGRTRLRWCGAGDPPERILASLASSPEVRRIDFRPTTGSLVLVHEESFGVDYLSGRMQELGIVLCEKPMSEARSRAPRAAPANGSKRAIVLPARSESAKSSSAPASEGGIKWAPIVAEIEAVVLLGLILGWIRDWLAGRNLAFGTVVLVLLSAIFLVYFWWRRQSKKEAAEPDLEMIFA